MASRRFIELFFLLALAGCSSAQKARLAEREKMSVASGMLCDFVNGDEYQDVEVQLNLQMALHCDSSKSFTVTEYKNASEVHGILYCCSMRKDTKGAGKEKEHDHGSDHEMDLIDSKVDPKAAPAQAPKKDDKKQDAAKPEAKKGAVGIPPSAPSSPAPASVGTPASTSGPTQPAKTQPTSSKPDMDAILDD